MYEFAGIGLIPDSVRKGNILVDERWKEFTVEELQALLDAFYNYESGEASNETVCKLLRGIITEIGNR